MTWCGRLITTALLLAALFGAGTAYSANSTAYIEYFTEGIRAMDEGDWEVAVRWLEAAAKEKKPDGQRMHIYGMRFVNYLPYYYLGLTQFELGDFDAAEDAWDESEVLGAIDNHSRELKQLKKMRKKGYALEGRVAGVYGIFTRGQARGTIELEHTSASAV